MDPNGFIAAANGAGVKVCRCVGMRAGTSCAMHPGVLFEQAPFPAAALRLPGSAGDDLSPSSPPPSDRWVGDGLSPAWLAAPAKARATSQEMPGTRVTTDVDTRALAWEEQTCSF